MGARVSARIPTRIQGRDGSPALHAADLAQMTPAEARISNPVLSTAARGYRQAGHIASVLFPRVNTQTRGGKTVEFSRDAWRRLDLRRAPGAAVQRIHVGHEGKDFVLRQSAVEGVLAAENRAEALVMPGLDLGMAAVDAAQEVVSLEREWEAQKLAAANTTYDASHRAALVSAARWDKAASNPSKDVETGIEAVRKSIGRRPNTVAMGASVYSACRDNAELRKQIFGDGTQTTPSTADLARLWQVETVAVGESIYLDADGDEHDVWGKVVIIAYTRVGPLHRPEPSFGHGYQLDSSPDVEVPYYERQCKSWIYPVTEEWSVQVVGKDAGYLISAVID